MSKYDDLVAEITAAVKANNDEVDSAVILMQSLTTKLQGAVDNQDFSAVEDVIGLLKAKDVELANAIVANTPSDPGTPPASTSGTPIAPAPTVSGATGTTTSPAPVDATTGTNVVDKSAGTSTTDPAGPGLDPAGTSTK